MKKVFLIILLAGIIFVPLASLAAGLVPCGGEGESPCQLCHLFVMFDNIIKFLLVPCSLNGGAALVPLVAVLMVAIGGFMYIFAYVGGVGKGPGMLSAANSLFAAVAIGLLIIYGAWLVINLFFTIIGVQEWTGLKEWWKIDCP